MNKYVLPLEGVDKSQLPFVGGKAANLGELLRIGGGADRPDVRVPDGFVVTTEAFNRIFDASPELLAALATPGFLIDEDKNRFREATRKIRSVIEETEIPEDIREEITGELARFGSTEGFAVRSSATAEDLSTASAAGQHDSYLNVRGNDNILRCVSRCWASLFTDRAVIYRLQNKIGSFDSGIAVIVQRMVVPRAAGVLFTANPTTGDRRVASIDAVRGLGEALVSGLVNPDGYTLRNGEIVEKRIASGEQVLNDGQILRLDRLGRTIEAHFGCPQDIEWCLADDSFSVVQSRPITTLYPIPGIRDRENHVYVSVGHQQMMTDAMRPLGISFWLLTAARPMDVAGSRLFVDVTNELASPAKRDMIINVLGKNDPLIKDSLVAILDRGDFIKVVPPASDGEARGAASANGAASAKGAAAPNGADRPLHFNILQDFDPSVVTELIGKRADDLRALKKEIQSKSGDGLFAFLLDDIQRFRTILADPQSFAVIMTAMNSAHWINEKMQEWLGETNVADTLSQSVLNNVTSEMGLALLDVADAIRPYPEVIRYLEGVKDDRQLTGLVERNGGNEAAGAIAAFLNQYGMRCAGEIDITRTRWSEDPAALVPMILTNVRNASFGASRRKFERGLQAVSAKQRDLMDRLRQLPDGEQKVAETQRMIDLLRNLAGYREYPKYSIVSRYLVYKQAMLREAESLVKDQVIREKEDIYYLTFDELREVVRSRTLDYSLVRRRMAAYLADQRLAPPRVMTSDGEIVTGQYQRGNIPAGALKGLAVSSGIIEGRARVIFRIEDAVLKEGDILVTTFTDPSWTPLFVSIKGLITEVGGLMTHGAVIAREYGLPAVVGVQGATRLIKDGQKIRVNGTEGFVEVLS